MSSLNSAAGQSPNVELTILDSLLLLPPISDSSIVSNLKNALDAEANINLWTENLVWPTRRTRSVYVLDVNIWYMSLRYVPTTTVTSGGGGFGGRKGAC